MRPCEIWSLRKHQRWRSVFLRSGDMEEGDARGSAEERLDTRAWRACRELETRLSGKARRGRKRRRKSAGRRVFNGRRACPRQLRERRRRSGCLSATGWVRHLAVSRRYESRTRETDDGMRCRTSGGRCASCPRPRRRSALTQTKRRREGRRLNSLRELACLLVEREKLLRL